MSQAQTTPTMFIRVSNELVDKVLGHFGVEAFGQLAESRLLHLNSSKLSRTSNR